MRMALFEMNSGVKRGNKTLRKPSYRIKEGYFLKLWGIFWNKSWLLDDLYFWTSLDKDVILG